MAKILIVDDENNIRLMLRLALKADGHEVTAASDGLEALELFGEGGAFALVVLDQRMPGMEGLEVLRIMKQRESGLKIIMATAFGTVDLAREAMRAGASGFLRKPFTTEVLRAAVNTALGSEIPNDPLGKEHFNTVSVNGFRLEAVGPVDSITHHEFNIHVPGQPVQNCQVELPDFFVELVKAQSDAENLQTNADFWCWLSEEALANYIWQHATLPENNRLIVDELTPNLQRWMDAVLAA